MIIFDSFEQGLKLGDVLGCSELSDEWTYFAAEHSFDEAPAFSVLVGGAIDQWLELNPFARHFRLLHGALLN